MSIASPMIKSAKGMKKKRKRISAIGVAYRSLERCFCFILEFLLDFRKDNLMILVIRYFFPYKGLVLHYRGLMFLRRMRFGRWEICGDFFPDIVIHNTHSLYGRMTGWGTQDPRRVLGLHSLVGSCVVLI